MPSTKIDVQEALRLYADGMTAVDIARRFGVASCVVQYHMRKQKVSKYNNRRNGPMSLVARECSMCRQLLPLDRFHKSGSNSGGYAYRCIDCAKTHPDHKRWHAGRYGLTVDELDGVVRASLGRCRICSTQFSSGRDAHVDHCHTLDVVRGLLCSQCNLGLGAFRDRPELLEAAAEYLRGEGE